VAAVTDKKINEIGKKPGSKKRACRRKKSLPDKRVDITKIMDLLTSPNSNSDERSDSGSLEFDSEKSIPQVKVLYVFLSIFSGSPETPLQRKKHSQEKEKFSDSFDLSFQDEDLGVQIFEKVTQSPSQAVTSKSLPLSPKGFFSFFDF
jgi:hypothetical protein